MVPPPRRDHSPSDSVEWRIQRWEQILPGGRFDRIEAAARIIQLADDLGAAMDRIARQESLANQDDYQVLSELRIAEHLGQDQTITDIAAKLGSTTATVVNRVDRLENLGYVQRRPHPTDRRSLHLTITPQGTACVQRIVLQRTQQRDRFLAALSDEERVILTGLLQKLAT